MSITPKLYTEQDNKFLKENYHIIGPKACSQHLGRTYSSICSQASRFGLRSNKFKIPCDKDNIICGKCQLEKSKSFFGVDKSRINGYYPFCKKCSKEIRDKNKLLKSQYDKNYRQQNTLKIKNYISQNRLKIRARMTNYNRKWRQIPHNRILQSCRSRLRKALGNKRKLFHTIDLLGCSVKDFKTYIESKFLTGMTWNNYGSHWHIDHIRPCISFNLTNPIQQRSCFHFTNLQPLWKIDNLKKGRKILQ